MAIRYNVSINPAGWVIEMDGFKYDGNFDKDSEIEGYDIMPFGQFWFMGGDVARLYNYRFIDDDQMKAVKNLSFTKDNHLFVAINTKNGANEKLAEFTGTFIDAFKFINKHKELLNL